jgi:hypothetical protein
MRPANDPPHRGRLFDRARKPARAPLPPRVRCTRAGLQGEHRIEDRGRRDGLFVVLPSLLLLIALVFTSLFNSLPFLVHFPHLLIVFSTRSHSSFDLRPPMYLTRLPSPRPHLGPRTCAHPSRPVAALVRAARAGPYIGRDCVTPALCSRVQPSRHAQVRQRRPNGRGAHVHPRTLVHAMRRRTRSCVHSRQTPIYQRRSFGRTARRVTARGLLSRPGTSGARRTARALRVARLRARAFLRRASAAAPRPPCTSRPHRRPLYPATV